MAMIMKYRKVFLRYELIDDLYYLNARSKVLLVQDHGEVVSGRVFSSWYGIHNKDLGQLKLHK